MYSHLLYSGISQPANSLPEKAISPFRILFDIVLAMIGCRTKAFRESIEHQTYYIAVENRFSDN